MFTETPSGAIDGANTSFLLTYEPVVGSLQLYRNGVLAQENVEYTSSGKTVTFVAAPLNGDWLRAIYLVAGATGDSNTVTTQIGDIANWASVEKLKRAELLAPATSEAVNFYKLLCARIPFDILQQTSIEQSTTKGTSTYSLSTLDPSLAGIFSIRMKFSTSGSRRLRRSHARVYDAISVGQSEGKPSSYARWGDSIELNPVPDSSVYTFRVRYWSRPFINSISPQNTLIITPPEWDELIRWETYYRVLLHLDEFEKAAQLVMVMPMPRQPSPKKVVQFEIGIIPRLWNDLLQTVSQRENVDEDFTVNPLLRPYTAVRGGR